MHLISEHHLVDGLILADYQFAKLRLEEFSLLAGARGIQANVGSNHTFTAFDTL
jgi:hypothetical protein